MLFYFTPAVRFPDVGEVFIAIRDPIGPPLEDMTHLATIRGRRQKSVKQPSLSSTLRCKWLLGNVPDPGPFKRRSGPDCVYLARSFRETQISA